MKEYRGLNIELFAPLVVARKGIYTELASWAAKKGFAHLRVDGKLLPTNAWPRLDRFKEHTIELPLGSLEIAARNEAALRDTLRELTQTHEQRIKSLENNQRKAMWGYSAIVLVVHASLLFGHRVCR